ncbi:hypothetical protein XENOCAPTIV_020141 [Xenoophorus captivus]|uniref:Uncharacterized protein n=1 Tax=Xenoophorus captivus TaxID=1517983 RepID=A0ABV0RI89_9TELE
MRERHTYDELGHENVLKSSRQLLLCSNTTQRMQCELCQQGAQQNQAEHNLLFLHDILLDGPQRGEVPLLESAGGQVPLVLILQTGVFLAQIRHLKLQLLNSDSLLLQQILLGLDYLIQLLKLLSRAHWDRDRAWSNPLIPLRHDISAVLRGSGGSAETRPVLMRWYTPSFAPRPASNPPPRAPESRLTLYCPAAASGVALTASAASLTAKQEARPPRAGFRTCTC